MDTTNEQSSNVPASAAAASPANRPATSRRRWLALLAVPLIAAAASTSAALAHGFGGGGPGPGGHGEHMQRRIDHLLDAAGASAAQKTQVKAIWDQLRPQIQPLRKQHGDLRRQIAEAMTAPTIDGTRIEQLRQQSVQTMDRLSALMTKGMVSSAQVLTPDQRKLVLQKLEEHRHQRFGGGEGAGGQGL